MCRRFKNSKTKVRYKQEMHNINIKNEVHNVIPVILLIAFQLLPVWILLLIQFVTGYPFDLGDYIGNLLVFSIVTCGSNLFNLFQDKDYKNRMSYAIVYIFILCFASILHCIVLLSTVTVVVIRNDVLLGLSLIFTLMPLIFSVCQNTGKESRLV